MMGQGFETHADARRAAYMTDWRDRQIRLLEDYRRGLEEEVRLFGALLFYTASRCAGLDAEDAAHFAGALPEKTEDETQDGGECGTAQTAETQDGGECTAEQTDTEIQDGNTSTAEQTGGARGEVGEPAAELCIPKQAVSALLDRWEVRAANDAECYRLRFFARRAGAKEHEDTAAGAAPVREGGSDGGREAARR